jgi:hypothetical protein
MARSRTVTVTIELQMKCDPDLAYDIVDAVLDGGTLQSALEEYGEDNDGGPVHVTQAFARYGGIVEPTRKRARTKA